MTTTQKAQEIFGILWKVAAEQAPRGFEAAELVMHNAEFHLESGEDPNVWYEVYLMAIRARECFLA